MHCNKVKFCFTSMINVIDISCMKTALVDSTFVTLAFDYVTQTMSHDLKKVSSCHNYSVNFSNAFLMSLIISFFISFLLKHLLYNL